MSAGSTTLRRVVLLGTILAAVVTTEHATLRALGQEAATGKSHNSAASNAANEADRKAPPKTPTRRLQAAKPSEMAFRKFQDSIPKESSQRDYAALLQEIVALCEKYPGSEAAYCALEMVRAWQDAGYVESSAAARVLEFNFRFNPASKQLDILEQDTASISSGWDRLNVRRIGEGLCAIAREHPGTLSEFIAMGRMGPMVERMQADSPAAFAAAETFLERFPPDATDLKDSERLFFQNLCLQAKMLSLSDDSNAGLDAYQGIYRRYCDIPEFAIPSLFNAGMHALKRKNDVAAIDCFQTLISNFGSADDRRIPLAHIYLGKAYLAVGRQQEAADVLVSIREDLGDQPQWQHLLEQVSNQVAARQEQISQDAESSLKQLSQAASWTRYLDLVVLIVVMTFSLKWLARIAGWVSEKRR